MGSQVQYAKTLGDFLPPIQVLVNIIKMNMAFDRDILAVKLLPQEQWHEEKS
ncbi:hypothetical protein H5410_000141 [Solanum commersonii]|uniref:Uncharacterized protein n=1 Tax=Solanum commersonii TaxID=4109 RepID=A0A9J6AV86_SOLCO|nr:hypothetical protein H5410_000141 [Solanum commersonii]